jgi:hypothetical protein
LADDFMVIHVWASVFAVADKVLVAVSVSLHRRAADNAHALLTMLFHVATPTQDHQIIGNIVVSVPVLVVDINV